MSTPTSAPTYYLLVDSREGESCQTEFTCLKTALEHAEEEVKWETTLTVQVTDEGGSLYFNEEGDFA